MTSPLFRSSGFSPMMMQSAERLLFALLFSVLLLCGRSIAAELTSEVLIGDAVSDLGPRYSNVDEAIKRFQNRDVLGARQFLEAAVRDNPKLPPVDLLLAKMYFLTGNGNAGLVFLEQTVQESPNDPEPYLVLGDQAIASGRTINAEALYEKGLKLIEGFQDNAKRKHNFTIKARNGHALVAERRKNWDEAAQDLSILIEEDPENAAAHYRLGRALFMLGKQSEGYDEFVAAKKLDADLPHPLVSSALLYEQLGSHDKAQQAFEKAVRSDKENMKTLTAYAQWLIQAGETEKAEAALAAARKIDPSSVDILSLSGVAARMAKKMKPAEDYFVEALRLAPSNSGVINQLALLLIDQPDDEKHKRALDFAEINVKLRPDSPEANITHSWVLYKLGRGRQADAAFRKGWQLGGLNADSSYLVAQMLVDQGQEDVARRLLERALDNSESSLFIMRQEAEALKDSLSN